MTGDAPLVSYTYSTGSAASGGNFSRPINEGAECRIDGESLAENQPALAVDGRAASLSTESIGG